MVPSFGVTISIAGLEVRLTDNCVKILVTFEVLPQHDLTSPCRRPMPKVSLGYNDLSIDNQFCVVLMVPIIELDLYVRVRHTHRRFVPLSSDHSYGTSR